MRLPLALLALATLACTPEARDADTTAQAAPPLPPVASCGISDRATLAGHGIGDLTIGSDVNQLRSKCEVLRDSTDARGNEGMPERKIAVVVGSDTIEAIVDSNSVHRLEITTSRIRTTDSLGVGTTAAELRAKDATLAVGDRGVFALVGSHCGVSFHLAGLSPTQNTWPQIPDSTTVDRVLVFGC
jgi:hypothetical protein